ncbi:MAG: hypothetical protein WEE89_20765 [Gemmatimonadota bacterium]
MISIRKFALAGVCAALVATAKPADAQILTGLVGAASGTATGGYITLSLVVARAQAGHYLHDFQDLFGWTSFPVIIGAATGTTVGIVAPDRLWSGFIYGAAGTAAGTGIGFVVGRTVTTRPEGKWAGAAIGAGAGMAIGSILGIIWPRENLLPDEVRNTSVVPVSFTIRF